MSSFKYFLEEMKILENSDKELENLKYLIDSGAEPLVYDVWGQDLKNQKAFKFDDLVKIGYAKKHKIRSSTDEVYDEWYEYTGPNTIVYFHGSYDHETNRFKNSVLTSGDITKINSYEYN